MTTVYEVSSLGMLCRLNLPLIPDTDILLVVI